MSLKTSENKAPAAPPSVQGKSLGTRVNLLNANAFLMTSGIPGQKGRPLKTIQPKEHQLVLAGQVKSGNDFVGFLKLVISLVGSLCRLYLELDSLFLYPVAS